MKEKMVVLLMLILSVSTAVLHGTCEEIQTIIAVVTTKKGPLKIRQEPSRNARELDEIARGTYVTKAAKNGARFPMALKPAMP